MKRGDVIGEATYQYTDQFGNEHEERFPVVYTGQKGQYAVEVPIDAERAAFHLTINQRSRSEPG